MCFSRLHKFANVPRSEYACRSTSRKLEKRDYPTEITLCPRTCGQRPAHVARYAQTKWTFQLRESTFFYFTDLHPRDKTCACWTLNLFYLFHTITCLKIISWNRIKVTRKSYYHYAKLFGIKIQSRTFQFQLIFVSVSTNIWPLA